MGLAAGCGRGALTGLGGCLAAVLGFSWVAGVSLVGVWALAAAELLAVGAALEAIWEVSPAAWGVECVDEDVVVVVDEVFVVVEVVESEAEERAVGDGGGPWALGAGVRCCILQVARTRVRAFSLVTRACWCWCGGVVSAAQARGLPRGWP